MERVCVQFATEPTIVRGSGSIGRVMQHFLQQLDADYYRSALLLIARTELEHLRQERSAGHLEKGSGVSCVPSPTVSGESTAQAAGEDPLPSRPDKKGRE